MILSHAASRAQNPVLLSTDTLTPRVYGYLATPAIPGHFPGVVLLPGSSGWRPVYPQLAKTLADSGFAVLALDYYGDTGRDTASNQLRRFWPVWQATIRRAVQWLTEHSSVRSSCVGLVGFSRGAFLAISVAGSIPSAKAVVDFFGGISTGFNSAEEQARGFPPLLILHGEADSVVPVASAYRLREAVLKGGGEVEMHLYPGAGHAFNGPFSPNYSKEATEDSFRRMVEFLRRRFRE